MSKDILTEELVLAKEYKWLLNSESHRTYKELTAVLSMAIDLLGQRSKPHGEKYIMNGPNGNKCILSLEGSFIIEADLNIKLIRHGNQLVSHHTKIFQEHPIKFAQLQEAVNHLNQALQLAETALELPNHETAHQLVNELEDLIVFLRKGRDIMAVPSKSALFNNSLLSKQFKSNPPLPADIDLNFSIQSPKIILSIRQLLSNHKSKPVCTGTIFMEATIPRFNDFMLILNRAFNLCQMLKDKFAYFLKLSPELLNLKRFESIVGDESKIIEEIDEDDDDIFGSPKFGKKKPANGETENTHNVMFY